MKKFYCVVQVLLWMFSFAIIGACLASGLRADQCYENSFGFFYLKEVDPDSHHHLDLVSLTQNHLMQVQLPPSAGYNGGGSLTFKYANGVIEKINVVTGTTIIKEAAALSADMQATTNSYFSGCFRLL